jgi:hypothetical protein
MPIQPIYLENGPNGLNWQCCLAGSSKTAASILIFLIAMGADYSFEVKNIQICVPTFFKHNNLSVATLNREGGHHITACRVPTDFQT